MRGQLLICMALLLPGLCWAGEPVPSPDPLPLTLRDCYVLALKRSETIATQKELIKETEGRFLQAFSGALPRASFEASEKRQDGSGSSAFTLKRFPERKFVFTQPLFSGFKEFAAMAGSRAERRQRLHEKARAEQLVFVDVANAFYLLLEQREDLSALDAIRTALGERLGELEERERLGRSRPSERVSAEAQLRRVLAEMESVRSQEAVARNLLAFLVGRDPTEGVSDQDLALPALEDEAVYLAKAPTRSDVLATKEASAVARKQVTIARAKLWPNVDLESNYYTKRAGAAAGVDWDVLVKVDVPLFQGGQTVGAIKERAAQARGAKLALSRAEREATLDIQDAYVKSQASAKRTAALEEALAAAEENYRLQREDYRRNLVNNLDVLQAVQALEDARRDLIHARYEAKRLYWQLRASVGETL